MAHEMTNKGPGRELLTSLQEIKTNLELLLKGPATIRWFNPLKLGYETSPDTKKANQIDNIFSELMTKIKELRKLKLEPGEEGKLAEHYKILAVILSNVIVSGNSTRPLELEASLRLIENFSQFGVENGSRQVALDALLSNAGISALEDSLQTPDAMRALTMIDSILQSADPNNKIAEKLVPILSSAAKMTTHPEIALKAMQILMYHLYQHKIQNMPLRLHGAAINATNVFREAAYINTIKKYLQTDDSHILPHPNPKLAIIAAEILGSIPLVIEPREHEREKILKNFDAVLKTLILSLKYADPPVKEFQIAQAAQEKLIEICRANQELISKIKDPLDPTRRDAEALLKSITSQLYSYLTSKDMTEEIAIQHLYTALDFLKAFPIDSNEAAVLQAGLTDFFKRFHSPNIIEALSDRMQSTPMLNQQGAISEDSQKLIIAFSTLIRSGYENSRKQCFLKFESYLNSVYLTTGSHFKKLEFFLHFLKSQKIKDTFLAALQGPDPTLLGYVEMMGEILLKVRLAPSLDDAKALIELLVAGTTSKNKEISERSKSILIKYLLEMSKTKEIGLPQALQEIEVLKNLPKEIKELFIQKYIDNLFDALSLGNARAMRDAVSKLDYFISNTEPNIKQAALNHIEKRLKEGARKESDLNVLTSAAVHIDVAFTLLIKLADVGIIPLEEAIVAAKDKPELLEKLRDHYQWEQAAQGNYTESDAVIKFAINLKKTLSGHRTSKLFEHIIGLGIENEVADIALHNLNTLALKDRSYFDEIIDSETHKIKTEFEMGSTAAKRNAMHRIELLVRSPLITASQREQLIRLLSFQAASDDPEQAKFAVQLAGRLIRSNLPETVILYNIIKTGATNYKNIAVAEASFDVLNQLATPSHIKSAIDVLKQDALELDVDKADKAIDLIAVLIQGDRFLNIKQDFFAILKQGASSENTHIASKCFNILSDADKLQTIHDTIQESFDLNPKIAISAQKKLNGFLADETTALQTLRIITGLLYAKDIKDEKDKEAIRHKVTTLVPILISAAVSASTRTSDKAIDVLLSYIENENTSDSCIDALLKNANFTKLITKSKKSVDLLLGILEKGRIHAIFTHREALNSLIKDDWGLKVVHAKLREFEKIAQGGDTDQVIAVVRTCSQMRQLMENPELIGMVTNIMELAIKHENQSIALKSLEIISNADPEFLDVLFNSYKREVLTACESKASDEQISIGKNSLGLLTRFLTIEKYKSEVLSILGTAFKSSHTIMAAKALIEFLKIDAKSATEDLVSYLQRDIKTKEKAERSFAILMQVINEIHANEPGLSEIASSMVKFFATTVLSSGLNLTKPENLDIGKLALEGLFTLAQKRVDDADTILRSTITALKNQITIGLSSTSELMDVDKAKQALRLINTVWDRLTLEELNSLSEVVIAAIRNKNISKESLSNLALGSLFQALTLSGMRTEKEWRLVNTNLLNALQRLFTDYQGLISDAAARLKLTDKLDPNAKQALESMTRILIAAHQKGLAGNKIRQSTFDALTSAAIGKNLDLSELALNFTMQLVKNNIPGSTDCLARIMNLLTKSAINPTFDVAASATYSLMLALRKNIPGAKEAFDKSYSDEPLVLLSHISKLCNLHPKSKRLAIPIFRNTVLNAPANIAVEALKILFNLGKVKLVSKLLSDKELLKRIAAQDAALVALVSFASPDLLKTIFKSVYEIEDEKILIKYLTALLSTNREFFSDQSRDLFKINGISFIEILSEAMASPNIELNQNAAKIVAAITQDPDFLNLIAKPVETKPNAPPPALIALVRAASMDAQSLLNIAKIETGLGLLAIFDNRSALLKLASIKSGLDLITTKLLEDMKSDDLKFAAKAFVLLSILNPLVFEQQFQNLFNSIQSGLEETEKIPDAVSAINFIQHFLIAAHQEEMIGEGFRPRSLNALKSAALSYNNALFLPALLSLTQVCNANVEGADQCMTEVLETLKERMYKTESRDYSYEVLLSMRIRGIVRNKELGNLILEVIQNATMNNEPLIAQLGILELREIDDKYVQDALMSLINDAGKRDPRIALRAIQIASYLLKVEDFNHEDLLNSILRAAARNYMNPEVAQEAFAILISDPVEFALAIAGLQLDLTGEDIRIANLSLEFIAGMLTKKVFFDGRQQLLDVLIHGVGHNNTELAIKCLKQLVVDEKSFHRAMERIITKALQGDQVSLAKIDHLLKDKAIRITVINDIAAYGIHHPEMQDNVISLLIAVAKRENVATRVRQEAIQKLEDYCLATKNSPTMIKITNTLISLAMHSKKEISDRALEALSRATAHSPLFLDAIHSVAEHSNLTDIIKLSESRTELLSALAISDTGLSAIIENTKALTNLIEAAKRNAPLLIRIANKNKLIEIFQNNEAIATLSRDPQGFEIIRNLLQTFEQDAKNSNKGLAIAALLTCLQIKSAIKILN